MDAVNQRRKKGRQPGEQHESPVDLGHREQCEDDVGERNGQVQRQQRTRPCLLPGAVVDPLVDAQPGVENDCRQGEDHRIEGDLLECELAATADPDGNEDHADHREHQVDRYPGNGRPIEPMIEHLDHDRPLASANLKTAR